MAESISSLSAINGKRFGRLTAVASAAPFVTRFGQKLKRWRFRCDCGTELAERVASVRQGSVRDCGCIARLEARRLAPRPTDPRLRFKPDYEVEILAFEREFGAIEVEQITINKAHTVFDKWLNADEDFFLRRHVRVVEHARDLWRCVSMPSAHYLEIGNAGVGGLEQILEGEMSARATNLLRRARSLVVRWKWEMFENVIRWNEPYGFPGSRLYGDKPKREEWAKLVVRDVAETVAKALFL